MSEWLAKNKSPNTLQCYGTSILSEQLPGSLVSIISHLSGIVLRIHTKIITQVHVNNR